MKAVNNYVIVDKIKNEPTKIAGLIMTEETDTDSRYLRGTVISAGDLVKGIDEGMIVNYDKHAGHGITVVDKLYYVIKIGDIVIVE